VKTVNNPKLLYILMRLPQDRAARLAILIIGVPVVIFGVLLLIAFIQSVVTR